MTALVAGVVVLVNLLQEEQHGLYTMLNYSTLCMRAHTCTCTCTVTHSFLGTFCTYFRRLTGSNVRPNSFTRTSRALLERVPTLGHRWTRGRTERRAVLVATLCKQIVKYQHESINVPNESGGS